MVRSILGIKLKDKISIAALYEKAKVKKVRVVAKILKYKYAGHMMRGDKRKWNHILTSWYPHWGKRTRGRPSTRWSDELRKTVGSDWPVKTKDRNSWKGLVKTLAQNWVVEGVDPTEGELTHLPTVDP